VLGLGSGLRLAVGTLHSDRLRIGTIFFCNRLTIHPITEVTVSTSNTLLYIETGPFCSHDRKVLEKKSK
jgi:hypothetical protein